LSWHMVPGSKLFAGDDGRSPGVLSCCSPSAPSHRQQCWLQELMPPDTNDQPASAFELTAAEVRVFALGCLGGCFEASAVAVDAKGVRVVGGPQRACLLTSPDHLEALSILHVQRC